MNNGLLNEYGYMLRIMEVLLCMWMMTCMMYCTLDSWSFTKIAWKTYFNQMSSLKQVFAYYHTYLINCNNSLLLSISRSLSGRKWGSYICRLGSIFFSQISSYYLICSRTCMLLLVSFYYGLCIWHEFLFYVRVVNLL